MKNLQSFCVRAASGHGFMAIACGAFGAHGLKRLLADLPAAQASDRLEWMATGARYQLAHATALLALAALAPHLSRNKAVPATWTLAIGTLIFSSTLYAMAFGGPLWLGAVTPLGGLLMLAGWALLFLAARGPDATVA